MESDRAAGEAYQIQGYPTIKFFGRNKKVPLEFESGERTFERFVEYSVAKMKNEIEERQREEPV
jgi:hypothetical protein